MNHFEVTEVDDRHMSLIDLRVWVKHFHVVDFTVVSDAIGNAIFRGVQFKLSAKYRESDTGHFSLLAPSRPAATKYSSIPQSIFPVASLFRSRTILYNLLMQQTESGVKRSLLTQYTMS